MIHTIQISSSYLLHISICHFSVYFLCLFLFFFNDTATTEIYTLSLHDALPIWSREALTSSSRAASRCTTPGSRCTGKASTARSEEHTSELQSRQYLVCRLLLEKKKKK